MTNEAPGKRPLVFDCAHAQLGPLERITFKGPVDSYWTNRWERQCRDCGAWLPDA